MSDYPSYLTQFDSLSRKQKNVLKKIPFLEEIDGWLLLSEAVELFSIASKITSSRPVICEIGTWKGKSAYVFSAAIQNKNGILYCIDPFNGDGDSTSKQEYKNEIKNMDIALLQNFKDTMQKYGLWNYVRVFPFLSEEARLKFPELKIDILFIDGNHDYNYVKKDYNLWSPLVSSKGAIVLHDVGAAHVDGPKRVAREYILNSQLWEKVRIVGEMVIAIKV